MVSRTVKITLSIFFAIASVRADLRLVPEVAEYELDGVKMRRMVFFDGLERVTYTPPAGWKYSRTEKDLFVLHPAEGARAEATITRTNLAQPGKLDDETIKGLTDEVLLSAPSGAKNVGIVSQEKNPVIIERKETFLVTIKYDYYGEAQERSVMFVNRKKEQLRFQLTSPRANFAELQKAFLASHFSWQNL